MRPDHAWVAYCYDMTCGLLGMWASSKLAETDKQGRPRHTISALLADAAAPHRRYRTDFDRFPVEEVA